ncbi:hypothetical protein Spla01_05057 [Streptomyces platensis]|uniref:Uncharacterized protein n=1 Tax=Streptomyces platensis TaxID=58346 RepID=A0ABX3XYS7_STRPT|nr:hypothetical protein [Streptomyces platensis]OSY45765.1 hypothetical protein BG653_02790 [Streptomyces platensis]
MPLIPHRCEECGERRPDVKRMPDPFVEGQGEEGAELMRLCPPCATARFEDS